ncbi:Nn.00g015280.m01.CDS01 [Neocucurbitaria sp. VM-36]
MSRPKSMPDFTALMDASTPLFEKRIHNRRQTSPGKKAHPRKNPSISLAAGLIMNTESPKSTGPLPSPRKQSRDRMLEGAQEDQDERESLFYAYALRSDYPNSPPYILTFASFTICSQWWTLVQYEYPDSARPSPQFFVLKSDDLEHIQDDPKFFELCHKWFYTSQDSPKTLACIIPLQNAKAHHVIPPQQSIEEKPAVPAMDSLLEKLERLTNVVETNAEQIHALSVAQSAGLQAMQEINESNSTQIKAIADSQIRLQALVDQNASHYIALANTSFQSQEKIKDIMRTTASQIQSLSKNQAQLANTCDSMMRGIDNLSTSVSQMNLSTALSDTASTQSTPSAASFSAIANRISPPPRKLNRRVKGVWYEYDTTSTSTGSPKRSVNFVDTPPKSPVTLKNT